jgi:predicted RNA polymerase sigma factor
MELSATGSALSEYHVEAAIASIHGRASGMEDTDWRAIIRRSL